MSQADNLFTDGNAYERMMGRWSRPAARHWQVAFAV